MAFKGILSSDNITMESKFRLKITNWDKYQSQDTHLFVKLIPAGIADSIRHESLMVRGLFFDLLRHASSSRKVGWIVEGDNQPITIGILADILHLNQADSVQLLPQIQRLIVTNRVVLFTSDAEFDAESLPCESLPELAKPSESLPDLPIKNRVEKSREEKNRIEKESLKIFNYYLSKHLKKHKRFDSWKSKIQARLKKYSIQELKTCIDNLANSTWHREKGFTGLEQVMDSDRRIENWLTRAPDSQPDSEDDSHEPETNFEGFVSESDSSDPSEISELTRRQAAKMERRER